MFIDHQIGKSIDGNILGRMDVMHITVDEEHKAVNLSRNKYLRISVILLLFVVGIQKPSGHGLPLSTSS